MKLSSVKVKGLGSVVQRAGNAIQRVNRYPAAKCY